MHCVPQQTKIREHNNSANARAHLYSIETTGRRGCAGNGLTDPAVQYGAYGDYAYTMKVISKDVRDRVARAYPACKCASTSDLAADAAASEGILERSSPHFIPTLHCCRGAAAS